MKHGRNWLRWGGVGSLLSLAWPATVWAEPCASVLVLSAPPDLDAPLRASLEAGELGRYPAEKCRGARVTLRRSEDGANNDLVVQLDAAERSISRRVASVADAALWIESWLEPELQATSPKASSLASAPVAAAAPAQPAPVRAAPISNLGIAVRSAFDVDGASWNGLELSGEIALGGPLWVGAGLGRSWDYLLADSALGDSIERVTTHAIIRAGGAWRCAGTNTCLLGLGVGMMSAIVSGPPREGTGIVHDDEGVAVAELSPSLHVPLASRWLLRLGLTLEHTIELEPADAQEPSEPLARVQPSWRVGLSIGLGFGFGSPSTEAGPHGQ